jgi:signal transduction histidine kinase
MNGALYLGTAMLSLANGIVMLIVNPSRAINRVFFFASAWIAVWFFFVFMAIREGTLYTTGPADSVLYWLRLSSAIAAFLGWIAWLMRSVLLDPSATLGQVLKSSWPWFCASLLISLLAFSEIFIPSDSTPLNHKRGPGYFIFLGMIALNALVLSLDAMRQMRHLGGARKIEMQFFVFNAICACLLIALLNLIGALLGFTWHRLLGPVVFIALHGLTVWAICYHRVFDAKQVIISIGHRVAFFCVLGGGTIVATAALGYFISHPFDILLAVLLSGTLAIICERPTRKWLGLDTEHLLLLPRRTIIDWARQEPDTEKLQNHFMEFLREWCQTTRIDFLSPRHGAYASPQLVVPADWPGMAPLCKNGWMTPEFLQRRRPGLTTEDSIRLLSQQQCGLLLAVPRGSDRPSLLIAFGQKRSLRPYTYPDIRLLLELAELMDNILTHANLAQHAAKIAQMESAAMMSRGLAHDLNNLTTPIVAYLLHAQSRAIAGTPEAEVYDAALHSVKIMNDYISESLFFSRRLVPKVRAIDPAECLTSIVRLAQGRASPRGITLESSCTIRTRFMVDPALFQRLALNLVNNAIDASPYGGIVTVSISVGNPDEVCLTVSDRGSGIPDENMKRIFDPYFTTKDTGDAVRGLGLGLAICRKIADLHHGEIAVRSAVGHGTTFIASFPVRGVSYHPTAEFQPSSSVTSAPLSGPMPIAHPS